MQSVIAALATMTPFDTDLTKVRIGPNRDGGYILLEELIFGQPVLSYGIADEYDFDREMAARGSEVHMFDHTIECPKDLSPNMKFRKEGVADRSSPDLDLFSIEDHLARYNINGDDLIMKMDIEGAEYEVILGTPTRLLNRFSQINIEFHHLNLIDDDGFRNKFLTVMRKLNKIFTIFHVHANNWDGPNTFKIVSGIPISEVMELSFVRSNCVRRVASKTLYPTSLDYPNTGNKEKLLWFFPFMPTTADAQLINATAERVFR